MEPEAETGRIDLDSLGLSPGGATAVREKVPLEPVTLGGQPYRTEPASPEVTLDVSRTTTGFALRLRFEVEVTGPCFRCLEPAASLVTVDVREVDQPVDELPDGLASGTADWADEEDEEDRTVDSTELASPYVESGELALHDWARDALILSLPPRILCREDCQGLCSVCGGSLNDASPDQHDHGQNLDPRWAKLRELD